jgi:hypothetical protein
VDAAALLPYPQALQLLLEVADAHASLGDAAGTDDQGNHIAAASLDPLLLAELSSPQLQVRSRLAKDILDPYEALGKCWCSAAPWFCITVNWLT